MLNENDQLLIDDLTKLLINVRKNWQKVSDDTSNSLTPPKYLLLHLLNKNKKMTVSELGKQVGLTSGAITTAVNKMVNNQLIKRQRDIRDHRVTWLELTDKGYQLIDNISATRQDLWLSLFEKLTDPEKEQFRYLLSKLIS